MRRFVAFGLIVVAIAVLQPPSGRSAAADRRQFPTFRVRDINGNRLSPDMYRGKVVVIDFWATWCPPCRREMPNVVQMYRQYHDQGLEIIGVNMDTDLNALRSYMRTNDIEWPQYAEGNGWDNVLVDKYEVESIPFTIVLDRQGRIYATNLRGDALKIAVRTLLAE